MAFQPNIPASTDKFSQSQAEIQGNFQAIGTLLNPTGGEVTFPVQVADQATSPTQVGLYSKTDALTTNVELYFRRQNNGAVYSMTSASQTGTGWSFLPSGLLVKWGTTGLLNGGAATFAYPVAATIPAFTNVFNVQLTIYAAAAASDPNTAVYVTAFSNLSFSVWISKRKDSSATSLVCMYYAIGN